jgi:hypothetical protein
MEWAKYDMPPAQKKAARFYGAAFGAIRLAAEQGKEGLQRRKKAVAPNTEVIVPEAQVERRRG